MPEQHLDHSVHVVVEEASAGPAAEIRASALGSTVRVLAVAVVGLGVVAVLEARWC